MFYILEIYTRIKYSILSYFFIILTCYFYYHYFFFLLDYFFRIIIKTSDNDLVNYYIYTHPFELYYNNLLFSFILSLYFFFPYLIWQIIDYMRSSLYNYEFTYIYTLYLKILSFFLVNYYILYNHILPSCLTLLESVKNNYLSSFYCVFFELKIQDFISFIIYINNVFNSIILFLIFLIISFFNIPLIQIINNKKFIYLFAIIIATFLSPPDVFSQIIFLLFLVILIEIIIYVRVYIFLKRLRQ